MNFITHARTAEELRLEVLSDLKRRLDSLTAQRLQALGAAARSRIDRAILELEDMVRFWSEIQIPKKEKRP